MPYGAYGYGHHRLDGAPAWYRDYRYVTMKYTGCMIAYNVGGAMSLGRTRADELMAEDVPVPPSVAAT